MSDNPSVEELLKSLRQTVEKRAKDHENAHQEYNKEVIELKNPIKSGSEHASKYGAKSDSVDPNVVNFLNHMIEQAVFRILMENQHLLKDAIEKLMFNSQDIKALFSQACTDYFNQHEGFEGIVRDAIEKKIARILRS